LACAVVLLAVVSSFILLPSSFGQGALTPPGPPAPTMKTLDQIEPRTSITNLPVTITQPGSYYLTTNLTMTGAAHGITVESSDVTIDLGGFVLDGNGAAFSGIYVPSARTNLVVRNGIVSRWNGAAGVEAFNAVNVHVERVHASGNGGTGVRTGFGSQVSDCMASGNSGSGFILNANSVIVNSVARLNGGAGIFTDNGCAVKGCTAAGNQSYGITVGVGSAVNDCSAQANQGDGIGANALTAIFHCASSQNAGNGIFAWGRSEIGSCVMSDNGGRGLYAGSSMVVKDCTVRGSAGPAGIEVGDASIVVACVANANGGTNDANGVVAGGGCTIKDCTAASNNGNGCTIADNTARANKLDGIRFGSSCGVTKNTCDFNGNGGDGAGLHATGQAARIEGNHAIANDRGVDVDADRNVILRNTAGFNTTDYDIVINNKVGVIVAAPNSGAISGSTGGAGVGTTDPWANLSY
jgi:hypothetical protein